MSNVRAKFKVESKQENKVVLRTVVDGSEENKKFWKYTPAGYNDLHIDNPDAMDQFEEGKEYYVDFTLAQNEKEGE